MSTLAIDIETYSPVDLKTAGVYRYAEHPDFEILLFAYAWDDGPVKVVDVAGEGALPAEVFAALTDPGVLKTAYNAPFEMTCLQSFFDLPNMDAAQWECTMVKAAMLGLPFGLDAVASVLRLDQAKMAAGKALIRYFSMPCKPTRTNGGRTRNRPHHDPDKWALYKQYCAQDVEVERAVRNKVAFYQIPEREKALWRLDRQINTHGVLVDTDFVTNALQIDTACRDQLMQEAVALTGLVNPNSVSQLKAWLEAETGTVIDSLSKGALPELVDATDSPQVKRIIAIRQELGKTSVKKYAAMQAAACADHRVRGLLQYYGANRTGRWAGRLVQVQNLPQNHLPDLDLARRIVFADDGETLAELYGNVPDTLSQLTRTAFIAPEGKRFAVADFSAIEARVIAWVAREQWRLDVFATHGKIYEASAAQMFRVPIESVTKGSELRQKGKVAELALGYQGGAGALKAMGALKMGLPEDDLQPLVDLWRSANRKIVQLWADVGCAALDTVQTGCANTLRFGITFSYRHGALWIKLPSGRELCYLRAKMGANRFGSRSIVYEGMNQTSKKWEKVETYGGKLVENIVQAIARDCLADAMLRLAKMDCPIVMHVHDEVVMEVPADEYAEERLSAICAEMGKPVVWAPGLPLRADGYLTEYYKKD